MKENLLIIFFYCLFDDHKRQGLTKMIIGLQRDNEALHQTDHYTLTVHTVSSLNGTSKIYILSVTTYVSLATNCAIVQNFISNDEQMFPLTSKVIAF